MKLLFGYAAGLTVNQRLSSRNQGSHDLNFDSQFRLSPHVSLRIAEEFSLTSGFFDSGNAGSVIGNVIWVVLFGIWLAIGHIITAVAMAITIIGIPLALANLKLIPVSLVPLGKEIVPVDSLNQPVRAAA